MPSTTRGYRYPDTTDKLADTDTHIHNLASDVEANVGLVKKGTDTIDIISASTVAATAVVFATPFPVGVTPVVVATPVTGNPDSRRVSVTAVSRTGFTMQGYNTASNADITCAWIAIG